MKKILSFTTEQVARLKSLNDYPESVRRLAEHLEYVSHKFAKNLPVMKLAKWAALVGARDLCCFAPRFNKNEPGRGAVMLNYAQLYEYATCDHFDDEVKYVILALLSTLEGNTGVVRVKFRNYKITGLEVIRMSVSNSSGE